MSGVDLHMRVFEFSKHDFLAVPRDDRHLLLLGGHALNLLGIWSKLLAATTNARVDDRVLDRMNAAQAQILLRTLVGNLSETWDWLNRKATHDLINNNYLRQLPTASREAYERLGKHFGPGLFARARNKFAFHFPKPHDLDQAFAATPDDHPFDWYLSDENTNSLYFGCEAVIGHGIYDLAKTEVEGRSGIMRLIPDTIAAVNDVNEFIAGLLHCIVRKYLSDGVHREFAVSGAPGPEYPLPFLLLDVFGEQRKRNENFGHADPGRE